MIAKTIPEKYRLCAFTRRADWLGLDGDKSDQLVVLLFGEAFAKKWSSAGDYGLGADYDLPEYGDRSIRIFHRPAKCLDQGHGNSDWCHHPA